MSKAPSRISQTGVTFPGEPLSLGPSADELQQSSKVLLWRQSILPLAIRRSFGLLSPAGLPTAMARSPDRLRDAAIAVVDALDRSILVAQRKRGESSGTEAEAVSAGLQEWFEGLTRAYSRPESLDLEAWLYRNEVDWSTREENWAWWQWLDALAGDRIALPTANPPRELLSAVARAAVVARASDAYNELQAKAAAVPLSGREELLLARWRDTDETVGAFDVVAALDLARMREIAYRAKGLIQSAVSESDWKTVSDGVRSVSVRTR